MQYHSPLRQSERQEHPDEVQLDQGCQAGIEDEDQQRSKQSQDDDPVGESEPVPEIIELMGHKAILGKHRRQSGEALKGCVGGQDEYRGGHRLHDIEQRAPPKAACAIWAITVRSADSSKTTSVNLVNSEIPRNMEIESAPIMARVVAALRD